MAAAKPRPVFLIPLVFLLGIFVARLPRTVGQLAGIGDDFFGPIAEAQQDLADTYVDKPDMAKLRDGAISGMLEALGDPYAQYIPPAERAEFDKELLGRFCGIGAQVQVEGGYPTIVTPLDDSPAFRAGILAGDKIIEVEGQSTLGMTIDESIARLTGAPDTHVKFKVRRGDRTLDFDLVRQEIIVRAVHGVRRDGPEGKWSFELDPQRHTAYIRLSQFLPTAADEMEAALESVGAAEGKLAGLILDLRDNPGGDLDSCLDIADMFIKDGVILSVRGREGPGKVYQANAEGTLPDFPMVVLVNGFSASASEIVAGALSDHQRAMVVGTRSYGKGLVQTVRDLPSLKGAQLKYTIQHYYLPSGRLIQRTDESEQWGVDPTAGFYVPMTDDEERTAALRRRDVDVLGSNPSAAASDRQPHWDDPAWIEGELKDKQLATAVRALDARLAEGKWTPQSDATQQVARIKLDEVRRLERTHQRMIRALAQIERRMDAMDLAIAGTKNTHAEPNLWPDDLDLTGGGVKVTDKEGKVVAELKITGRELERWLALADVEVATERRSDGATKGGEKQEK